MRHLTKYEKFWITYLTPAVLHIGFTMYCRRKGVTINYLQPENIYQWPGWWPILTLVPIADFFEIEPILQWLNVQPGGRRRPRQTPHDDEH